MGATKGEEREGVGGYLIEGYAALETPLDGALQGAIVAACEIPLLSIFT